jgi:hypothetical protein
MSLVGGAIGVYQIISASREQTRAEGSAAVFEQATLPVVPPVEKVEAEAAEPLDAEAEKDKAKKKLEELPSFPTEQARAQAIVKAADDVAKAQPLVGVLVGAAKAVTGDHAAHLAAVEAALAQTTGEALELPLRIQRAQALAALGKTAESAAEWAKVQSLDPTTFGKALAQARQGDLYNPNVGSKTADAAKAKAAYEGALKTARVGDKDPAAGSLGFLVADVRLKIARL